MLQSRKVLGLLLAVLGAVLGYLAATAQQGPPQGPQTTGVIGSPSATTTIDGKYLPNPQPKFGGEINLNAAQSKPWFFFFSAFSRLLVLAFPDTEETHPGGNRPLPGGGGKATTTGGGEDSGPRPPPRLGRSR
jgi:hypothetical protein